MKILSKALSVYSQSLPSQIKTQKEPRANTTEFSAPIVTAPPGTGKNPAMHITARNKDRIRMYCEPEVQRQIALEQQRMIEKQNQPYSPPLWTIALNIGLGVISIGIFTYLIKASQQLYATPQDELELKAELAARQANSVSLMIDHTMAKAYFMQQPHILNLMIVENDELLMPGQSLMATNDYLRQQLATASSQGSTTGVGTAVVGTTARTAIGTTSEPGSGTPKDLLPGGGKDLIPRGK